MSLFSIRSLAAGDTRPASELAPQAFQRAGTPFRQAGNAFSQSQTRGALGFRGRRATPQHRAAVEQAAALECVLIDGFFDCYG
mmetsp:Transcript_105605/g.294050  ORF Transcript_105605/g.294050 Transcript_105605/m.294050 type:complete len:83 (-) Transcript_105605:22-270(-)